MPCDHVVAVVLGYNIKDEYPSINIEHDISEVYASVYERQTESVFPAMTKFTYCPACGELIDWASLDG